MITLINVAIRGAQCTCRNLCSVGVHAGMDSFPVFKGFTVIELESCHKLSHF